MAEFETWRGLLGGEVKVRTIRTYEQQEQDERDAKKYHDLLPLVREIWLLILEADYFDLHKQPCLCRGCRYYHRFKEALEE